MKKTFKFFDLFLGLYLAILFYHLYTLSPENIYLYAVAALGILFAVIAHRQKHWISIPFITFHMVIEALEFAPGSDLRLFLNLSTVLLLAHIGLDVFFLRSEVRKHFYYSRKILFPTILLAVGAIYLFAPASHSASVQSVMEKYHEIIELFVVGGVIGCVASHLLPHNHKSRYKNMLK